MYQKEIFLSLNVLYCGNIGWALPAEFVPSVIYDSLVILPCTFPVVDTEDDSFLLLWSTQAKQSLLIVSFGVLQNSLLKRLSILGLVFRTDLPQVHLAA